jgi:diguanylate cyclase (GGDEF)-like protein
MDHDAEEAPSGVTRFLMISKWPMWTSPSRVLTSILIVEATAILLVGLTVVTGDTPRIMDLVVAAVLLGLGLVHTEVAVRVERARRQVTGAIHVDLSSVWTFAAALLLPPVLAAVLAVVIQGHLWRRAWYPRVPVYRQVFTISTVVLACLAAHTVVHAIAGDTGAPVTHSQFGITELIAVVLGVLTYTTVNSGLVAGAVVAGSPQPNLAAAIGEWEENFLEIATLCLGGLAAICVSITPYLGLFVMPAVLCLHRAVLVRQLREAADTDAKTGLLNSVAWHNRAQQTLRRRSPEDGPCAVLVLDLDHFKAINDNHGHLAGDNVLAAVADGLRSEVRDRDLVGRFGGEEFVVLLAAPENAGPEDLHAVAERIRGRIAGLRVEMPTPDGPLTISGISVSIGAAMHPEHGADVVELLQVADNALYAAKSDGRNVVRVGTSDGGAVIERLARASRGHVAVPEQRATNGTPPE